MLPTQIPFLLMRGGTSRGPYFNKADLPEDRDELAKVLIAAVGSGHPLNIDGIGGGNAVTTKVAILSPSSLDDFDVDYFFAQVSVEDKTVDFKPTCGNILSGVGPAAIEMGMVKPVAPKTQVSIHAVNTGAKVTALVHTDGKDVIYHGDHGIDGVPGTAAPIGLNFMEVAGSSTGHFLPTGKLRDKICGIEVTCMDVAMPMVIARAQDFGLTGYESIDELNANREFFAQMEKIRIQAGALMGMGDVTKSVTPKFGLLAKAQHGGTVSTRYFMPWSAHPTMAVTGSQCMAACALAKGSVADGMLQRPTDAPATITLEHPMGNMDVVMDWEINEGFKLKSAGLVRSARKVAKGTLFIPK